MTSMVRSLLLLLPSDFCLFSSLFTTAINSMKLQANDLPILKNQTRRKTPRIAPLVVLALLLLAIIPIYYPFLWYQSKTNSSDTSSSSRISLLAKSSPSSFCHDDLSPENAHCSPKDDKPHQTATAGPDDEEDEEPNPEVLSHGSLVKEDGRDLEITNAEKETEEQPKSDVGQEAEAEAAAATGTNEEDKGPELQGIDDGASTSRRRDIDQVLAQVTEREKCDIFSGEWVPNPEGPYYTNLTCFNIQEHQNCMKFGRPDTQYLKWRWKPEGCELPIFDPFQFLELMRGKSLAFVGDSVARNHMQSLICLLSRVEEPEDVSEIPYISQFKRYEYRNHNFTIEMLWSPYLVRTTQSDPNDTSRPFNLFLDEFDPKWTAKIEPFDYVIISAGHWFFRPTMFFLEGRLAGCLYCSQSKVTHLSSYFSYRRAFRTAFRAINSLENYKGVTFLRTFAPSHFENGYWDKGGDCMRQRPFKRKEAKLEGYNMEFYSIQLKELKIAERLGRRKGLRFRLFDVTQAMLLRPDGHPSKYGHRPETKVQLANDCVHWCLPGPVDAWNDFLVELLMREEQIS
ncbi:protein trichome birefringence-like 19 [Diospyros lotus]|uniref:protein trichome birefringence-like 19 n=1 Tax=Diospyros lotus TaxID=55363 RepID=UPI00224FDC41|nr:protein trichome birefringence-like 19 [Diospyros lotus]